MAETISNIDQDRVFGRKMSLGDEWRRDADYYLTTDQIRDGLRIFEVFSFSFMGEGMDIELAMVVAEAVAFASATHSAKVTAHAERMRVFDKTEAVTQQRLEMLQQLVKETTCMAIVAFMAIKMDWDKPITREEFAWIIGDRPMYATTAINAFRHFQKTG